MFVSHCSNHCGVTVPGSTKCQVAKKAMGASPMAARGGGMALPMSSHASVWSRGRIVCLGGSLGPPAVL
eukprot:16436856-Heterocapsa_arctica.AAC.1